MGRRVYPQKNEIVENPEVRKKRRAMNFRRLTPEQLRDREEHVRRHQTHERADKKDPRKELQKRAVKEYFDNGS